MAENNKCEEIILRTGIFLCAFLCLCKSAYASSQQLNINAETEHKFSDFQRDPEPVISSTGNSLSQAYKLYLDGGMLKYGSLNGMFGASLDDKYRKGDTDFENKLRFDYGRWLALEGLTHHETDEEIFFSGTSEPQSPIHSIIKKYNARLNLSRASSIEYGFQGDERRDVLLGTVTGEKTESDTVRFKYDARPLSFNSEYRESDFDDLLGTRSDIKSRDLNLDMTYRPKDSFSATVSLDNKKDTDITNNTSLDSQDAGFELAVKPFKGLKLRNRLRLTDDEDSKTGEDITNKSDEIILNIDPIKQAGLEFSYKKADEDKQRDSSDISSEINENKFRLRLEPINAFDIQTGYEVSDKSSNASSENIENTKVYSDVSFMPVNDLRFNLGVSDTEQKNTFTSSTESDTKLISGSVQYRPKQSLALFMQADSSKTDNPSTGAFTKTDTLSSNLNIDPASFLNVSLRNSNQKTTGTSASALSKRMLNALEFNIKLLDSLKVSTEYEMVNSSGATSSDENLFDISTFYNAGKLDLSLRFQDRSVSGDNPLEKTTFLSSIKYSLSKDAVLSFRFSLIDNLDKVNSANSFDSTTIESQLSLRF